MKDTTSPSDSESQYPIHFELVFDRVRCSYDISEYQQPSSTEREKDPVLFMGSVSLKNSALFQINTIYADSKFM